MIHPLFFTLEKLRRAPRIALFFCLAIFLFLAGAAYANLSDAKTVPTGQDSVLPFQVEERIPNPYPAVPAKVDDSDARLQPIPIRHFPANDGDLAIPTGMKAVWTAGISTCLIPTGSRPQQLASAGPQFPSLLRGL